MKCSTWIALGVGTFIGSVGGMLLMNNCRTIRNRVSDMQHMVADKLEAKKRKIVETGIVKKYGLDEMVDDVGEAVEVKTKPAPKKAVKK